MKIKFINRLMCILRGGGEYFALNIASALQSLGCEVRFLVSKPLFGAVRIPLTEFNTDYVCSPYLRGIWYKTIPSRWRIVRYGGAILGQKFDTELFERAVFKTLKNVRDCDLIQITAYPSLASRIENELNIPTVVRFPGPPDEKYKEYIRRCSAVIANGDAYLHIKEKIRPDVFDIPPGIDTEKFKHVESNVRKEYGIADDEVLLLFVGRFVPVKNPLFLIEGFKEIVKRNVKVKLMLVGEGNLEPDMKKQIENYSISENVIFTGRIDNDKLPQFYSAADIFVITSTYDNFPNVVLEAMSCELPIVATRVGGIPLQIDDGVNGFLVEGGNIEQFSEVVLKLTDDVALRRIMGRMNREKVKDTYNWHNSARRLLEICEKVLGG